MSNKETKLKTVAIQGVAGAFHEIAARNYFKSDIEIQSCKSFEEITTLLEKQKIDYGIMAIENTVAGSLIPNYVLIKEANVKIIGEEFLRVKQNLVALPGQKIEDLTEVHSHYMAIAQSRKFFKEYPKIKLVEAVDTALSAKNIYEKRLIGKGAISSDLAAKMYNLEILAPSIETNKKNYTRFLILTNKNSVNNLTKDINKVSVCFSLPHNKGSLAQILSVFTFYDLNMTKIQSMPIVGKEFQYFFYVDLTFDGYERYQQSLSAIKPLVVDLQILGEYKYGIESLGNIHHL